MRKKIKIGDIFKDDKRDLTVIDIKPVECNGYKKNLFKYHCNDCGYEDWRNSMVNRCRCCTNQIVVQGINDISTTAPWMMKYLYNLNDGYTHAKTSKSKVDVICPDCGMVHNIYLYNLFKTRKVACHCRDKISYPNKFMYSLLTQLGVNFVTEKSFDWSHGKLYDDYIVHNGNGIIVENHGQQHFTNYQFIGGQTLAEQQQNDTYKQRIALENGIDYYIVLDCRQSNKDFIKASVMSSYLPKLLGFCENDIDWSQCDEFATSNITKQVCEHKRTHPDCPTTELSKMFGLTKECIRSYLRKGAQNGWCLYDPTTEKARERDRHGTACKPIYNITTNEYFRDSMICEKHFKDKGYKISYTNIRKVCRGQREHCAGMNFQEISHAEFNKAKELYPDRCYGELIIIPNQETTT